jgi:hypothetical protein
VRGLPKSIIVSGMFIRDNVVRYTYEWW